MCGISAILIRDNPICLNDIIKLINSLENRGKDSFGISYKEVDNDEIKTIKSLKKFEPIYDNKNIKFACGHNRYSTTKNKNNFNNEIQPIHYKNHNVNISLVHNGNIPFEKMNITYEDYDETISDTQNLVNIFFKDITDENFEKTLIDIIDKLPGSFAIMVLYKDSLYAWKDIYNYKPLVLGNLNGNYCLLSENCVQGFEKIRYIQSGELLKINKSGYKTIYKHENKLELKCIFEYIYFMNPHTKIFNNSSIYNIRYNLGRKLAESETIKFEKKNTVVVGSPNTAKPGGQGWADALDLHYCQVIEKKDSTRTFILKDTASRKDYLKKFILHKDLIKDKVIVLIDDSICRGNTLNSVSKMFLEDAEAKELHIRIFSPEVKNPCYFGIDLATKDELIAANHTIEEIEKMNNLNSLRYISVEDMLSIFPNSGFCSGCFTGKYNNPELECLDW